MKVTIVGAGLMGAQIGADYLAGGHDVTFLTRSQRSAVDAVARALAAVETLVANGLAPSLSDARDRAHASVTLAEAARDAELIVESLPERMETKVAALREAAASAPGAILASNTSSLSITELGAAVGAAARVIGTHYLNPATLMPLVEVVRGRATAEDVVSRVAEILRSVGKEPVFVRDVPGFAWNRLQFALLREAASLVSSGVVDRPTIDLILRRGLGRRLSLVGPFETMALGGRDTFKKVAEQIWPDLTTETSSDMLDRIDLPDPEGLVQRRGERDRKLIDLLREERNG
jgi:3-hydroxybutyryl-CoA dehydrogenase